MAKIKESKFEFFMKDLGLSTTIFAIDKESAVKKYESTFIPELSRVEIKEII